MTVVPLPPPPPQAVSIATANAAKAYLIVDFIIFIFKVEWVGVVVFSSSYKSHFYKTPSCQPVRR